MANFDPNQWYQLTVKSGIGVSMYGSSLFDHGLGTIYFKTTNTTLPTERWQLFPFNSSTYVLRSQDSGHNGYLAATYSVNETTPGQTRPEMRNYTLADNSMFWRITPWGDGTFYLTNLANGTAWHLEVNPDTLMAMSSNFTTPQDGGSFSFTQLGAINDQAFSTINVSFLSPTTDFEWNVLIPHCSAPRSYFYRNYNRVYIHEQPNKRIFTDSYTIHHNFDRLKWPFFRRGSCHRSIDRSSRNFTHPRRFILLV